MARAASRRNSAWCFCSRVITLQRIAVKGGLSLRVADPIKSVRLKAHGGIRPGSCWSGCRDGDTQSAPYSRVQAVGTLNVINDAWLGVPGKLQSAGHKGGLKGYLRSVAHGCHRREDSFTRIKISAT